MYITTTLRFVAKFAFCTRCAISTRSLAPTRSSDPTWCRDFTSTPSRLSPQQPSQALHSPALTNNPSL